MAARHTELRREIRPLRAKRDAAADDMRFYSEAEAGSAKERRAAKHDYEVASAELEQAQAQLDELAHRQEAS